MIFACIALLSSIAFQGAGPSPCFSPYCVTSQQCPPPQVLSWDRAEAEGELDLVVGLSAWSDLAAVTARVESMGGMVVGGIPQVAAVKVRGLSTQAASALPGARYASLNGDFHGMGASVDAPMDAHFGEQWHLDNTGQPWPLDGSPGTPGADINVLPAWRVHVGSPRVVVAVLDSGIDYCHPEFAGRVLRGHDFVDDDDLALIQDCFANHGLYVTGLLAAGIHNASGSGVVGVAPGVSILPVRVWQNPGVPHPGQDFDLAEALCWVADDSCVRVVNMSLAKYPWDGGGQVVQDALAYAASKGKALVVAAGNGDLAPPLGQGPGSADLNQLATSPHTIAVGNLDHRNSRALDSSTGAALDFMAHGSFVLSVAPRLPGGGYPSTPAIFKGTSAAAPQVSGVLALMFSVQGDLSVAEAVRILQLTADDQIGMLPGGVWPDPADVRGWDPVFGHGRLNAGAALAALQ